MGSRAAEMEIVDTKVPDNCASMKKRESTEIGELMGQMPAVLYSRATGTETVDTEVLDSCPPMKKRESAEIGDVMEQMSSSFPLRSRRSRGSRRNINTVSTLNSPTNESYTCPAADSEETARSLRTNSDEDSSLIRPLKEENDDGRLSSDMKGSDNRVFRPVCRSTRRKARGNRVVQAGPSWAACSFDENVLEPRLLGRTRTDVNDVKVWWRVRKTRANGDCALSAPTPGAGNQGDHLTV